jgi:hypothetical protein
MALLAARKEDARVFVRNGRLVIQSQGQLPPDVMVGLQEHRDRLVEILTLEVGGDEYDRLGEEIDALADEASAARLAGDVEKADRLGQACRELVEGPYRAARLRMAPTPTDEAA